MKLPSSVQLIFILFFLVCMCFVCGCVCVADFSCATVAMAVLLDLGMNRQGLPYLKHSERLLWSVSTQCIAQHPLML